jgi:hypothetical protein
MKPIKKYKLGLISLSAWKQTSNDKTFYTFSFQRSYKDKEDNWQQTQQLRLEDLPKLKLLLEEAYKDIVVKVEK